MNALSEQKISTAEWERHAGGSPEAEAAEFRRLAKDILLVQHKARAKAGALRIDRAFHAKPLLAVSNARLVVRDDLPTELVQGHFRPGAVFEASVRFSNANGAHQGDGARDLRGVAIRLGTDAGYQDLLMTNFPVPHARDARQFVNFALAMSGSRPLGIVKLLVSEGPRETVRMMRNVIGGSGRTVKSLATESFWSRGAMLWGTAGPVRYVLRPVTAAPGAAAPETGNPGYLSQDIARRLAQGDVEWELAVQRFVSEKLTPVEDAATEWRESDSPFEPVARLIVPQQDITTSEAQAAAAAIDDLAFNPWVTTDTFRPLGNLNRARKEVYAASAAHRTATRFVEPVPLRNRVFTGLLARCFDLVNQWRPWYRLPLLPALMNLSLERHRLRQKNLIDTEPRDPSPAPMQPTSPIPEEARTQRSFDGSYTDLSAPEMGKVGATFGRNMAPIYLPDLEAEPNAAEVARTMLHRQGFKPAGILNVLAAAWIQFQVHDWVQHARRPLGERDLRVKMPGDGRWSNRPGGPEEDEMRIAGDLGLDDPRSPRTFPNAVSHWWDGSEVYGADAGKAAKLREGAFLRLEDGYLPEDMSGMELTGFNESWWLGLSVMHTLFAREHNAVAEALQREYRHWSDDRVFHTARLVISALIAKIHTVEWTPAILPRPEIDIGLNANWSGPAGAATRFGLWLTEEHALRGIPDTLPDHHTAPYCLTEDFVTVYRLHPLLPDEYRLHDARSGAYRETLAFNALQGRQTDEVLRRVGLENAAYSLGIANPGAIALHNYPRALTDFVRPGVDGSEERIDLSVVDIMRERSRGIPRYNKFRKGLHKPEITRWEDITTNPEDVRLLKDLYGRINHVDTVVGLTAEPAPVGFGFSDTAFRIFILMATRRLQSDRFLTVDFRPEIYSPLGIDWVQKTTMTDIVLRHLPDLAGVMPTGQSAFAPWRPRAV